MDILFTCDKKLSPFVRKVNVTTGMALNALSNVTVNITSAPLAKSFVDIKTGLTVGLNCISFAFNTVKLLLHRKNQVLFMIPGPPYSYCFFCFFFAALFQFVQSSPVYNAFPFTLSCLRTFWISSLPFLSAAIHKGL